MVHLNRSQRKAVRNSIEVRIVKLQRRIHPDNPNPEPEVAHEIAELESVLCRLDEADEADCGKVAD